MRAIKVFAFFASVSLLCVSCAGWPFNQRTPEPPEGLTTVRVYAVAVPGETFDRIVGEEMSYEDAADLWHRGPSITIYLKEVPYEEEDTDPTPPPDAEEIRPDGSEYPVRVSGLRMHRFEDRGLFIVCGRGDIYYGKSLVELSPEGMSINGEVVEVPDLTVHAREVLDETRVGRYAEVRDVADVVVSSDGCWWEGVKHVSP